MKLGVSGKEAAILRLLIDGGKELYGLEMVERSGGALKRGTVYPTLARMEDKGLITSRKEEAEHAGVIPRRLYQVTGYGRRVMAAADSRGLVDESLEGSVA